MTTKTQIDCACGNHLAITHARTDAIQDAEWESEGWEKINGAWKCWQCLGKPMPASIREAIRDQELDELAAEPEGKREDALDFLERLEGPESEGGPR